MSKYNLSQLMYLFMWQFMSFGIFTQRLAIYQMPQIKLPACIHIPKLYLFIQIKLFFNSNKSSHQEMGHIQICASPLKLL